MSFTGLKTINATSINNQGLLRLGSNLEPGTVGQVVQSQGDLLPAVWGPNSATLPNALTMGTNLSLGSGNPSFDGSIADTINSAGLSITGGNGISIVGGTEILTDNDNTTINNSGGTGQQNQVLKVPNSLTAGTNITFSSGTTYDGSSAITIEATSSDTQLNLTAALPIVINDLGGLNREVDIDIDTATMGVSGGELEVLKVPNTLTFTGYATGSFDGSSSLSINLVDTDTTYTAGTNLNLSGTTFNLDTSITGQTGITFLNSGASTNLTGSNYANKPTTATYLDLTSSTNKISGVVLATKIHRTSLVRTCSTTYIELTSNFRTSFVAQSANVYITLSAILRSDNRIIYGGLYDYNTGAWIANTRTRFCYNDENDQDFGMIHWFMTGLTAGTTYYISPYFRGNSYPIYIIGGSTLVDGNAPIVMRIYDGGNNVTIY